MQPHSQVHRTGEKGEEGGREGDRGRIECEGKKEEGGRKRRRRVEGERAREAVGTSDWTYPKEKPTITQEPSLLP